MLRLQENKLNRKTLRKLPLTTKNNSKESKLKQNENSLHKKKPVNLKLNVKQSQKERHNLLHKPEQLQNSKINWLQRKHMKQNWPGSKKSSKERPKEKQHIRLF